MRSFCAKMHNDSLSMKIYVKTNSLKWCTVSPQPMDEPLCYFSNTDGFAVLAAKWDGKSGMPPPEALRIATR